MTKKSLEVEVKELRSEVKGLRGRDEPAEFKEAQTELAGIGPGWVPFRADGHYRAERAGSAKYEMAATELEQLVEAVKLRESQLFPTT